MKKNNQITGLVSNDTAVLHYQGESLNIQKSSRPKEFNRVANLIKKGKIEELITAFIDIKKSIEKYTKNKVSVEKGILIDKKQVLVYLL